MASRGEHVMSFKYEIVGPLFQGGPSLYGHNQLYNKSWSVQEMCKGLVGCEHKSTKCKAIDARSRIKF